MSALLRPGITVRLGEKYQGSDFYLQDVITAAEWNIKPSWGNYLLHSLPLTPKEEKELQDFLKAHALSHGLAPRFSPNPTGIRSLLFRAVILFRPQQILTRPVCQAVARFLFSPPGLCLWAALACMALALVFGQVHGFIHYAAYYLDAPVCIVLGLLLTKFWHETGHAMAVVQAGGQVRGMGVMLILFAPFPYTEAGPSGHFTRQQKITAALAGIYFESWIALIAVILWAGLEDGPLRIAAHFLALVSLPLTLAMNLMAFGKFDGYRFLSAFLNRPALYEDGRKSVFIALHKVLGIPSLELEGYSARGRALVFLYGLFVLISLNIAIPLMAVYLSLKLGRISAVLVPGVMYFFWIRPVLGFYQRIIKKHRKERAIMRRVLISAAFVLLALAWLVLPLPHVRHAPAYLIKEKHTVVTQGEGWVTRVLPSGQVMRGELLARYADTRSRYSATRTRLDRESLQVRAIQPEEPSTLTRSSLDYLDAVDNENAANLINQDIAAPFPGWWQVEERKSYTTAGAVVGRLFPDAGGYTIRACLPANMSTGQAQGVLITTDGHRYPLTLQRVSYLNSNRDVPDWFQLPPGNYTVYIAADSQALRHYPETRMVLQYRQTYSILIAFLERLYFRQTAG